MTQPLNENQLFMSTVTRVNYNLKCYMIVVLLKKRGGGGGGNQRMWRKTSGARTRNH